MEKTLTNTNWHKKLTYQTWVPTNAEVQWNVLIQDGIQAEAKNICLIQVYARRYEGGSSKY